MNPRKVLIVLGVLTALAPFIGLPRDVLVFLLPIIGGSVIATVLFLIPKNSSHTEVYEPTHDAHAT